MDIRLNGRSAVITGGSKGLGLATAQRFAASGADVAILARTPETLAAAKQQIQAGPRVRSRRSAPTSPSWPTSAGPMTR